MKTWTILLKREVKQYRTEEIEVEVEAETEDQAYYLACNEADVRPYEVYSQVDDEDVEEWEVEYCTFTDLEPVEEEFDWSVSH